MIACLLIENGLKLLELVRIACPCIGPNGKGLIACRAIRPIAGQTHEPADDSLTQTAARRCPTAKLSAAF